MFSLIDYCVFSGMLLISVLIGLYFGFCGKKQTTDEYLLGGKTMQVLPIALSLIASQVSGITMLALPSDVYLYGVNYVWLNIPIIVICIMTCFVYLPVISKLNVPSVFEYINLRFNKTIRIIASCLFIFQVLLYNPVVAYIPAIAFSQASGISVQLITPVVCIICIFYTAIGGFKAVVWTDAVQFTGMVGSVIAIFTLGVISAGGFARVWEIALHGQRLELDFSFDPTIREGFWPILLGGTMHWMYNICFQPGNVQKYLSVATLANAKKVAVIYCCGLIVINMFSILTGIIMYAKYENCDPLSTGEVTRNDQILPYFVMDVAKDIPGLPGIFIAGIFSAALSTLSSTFNALAATIYSDFLSPFLSPDISQKRASNILKIIVVVSGTVCTILTFFIDRMGSLFPFVNASQGLMCGLLFGLFSLGMLFPMANSKGALWGSVTSFSIAATIAVLNQWYKLQGVVETFAKPVSVAGCDIPVNFTSPKSVLESERPFIFFRLSFWYNALIAAVVLTAVGLIVSWVTKKDDDLVDPDLISPISRYWLLKDRSDPKSYYNVEKATEMVTYNTNHDSEVQL